MSSSPSTVAILAVKEASSTVPIVMNFIGEDPVAKGLADSLARPGGSATGVAMLAAQMDGKRAAFAATPTTGHLTLLTTLTNKNYSANDFSEQFGRWRDAAGLPQRCVFHGLRKAAARRLAEAGCTAHEIMSITGHSSLKEVERYTKAADQARLAGAGMERIGTGSVKPVPGEVSNALSPLPKKAG
jgi:hypothetical protein